MRGCGGRRWSVSYGTAGRGPREEGTGGYGWTVDCGALGGCPGEVVTAKYGESGGQVCCELRGAGRESGDCGGLGVVGVWEGVHGKSAGQGYGAGRMEVVCEAVGCLGTQGAGSGVLGQGGEQGELWVWGGRGCEGPWGGRGLPSFLPCAAGPAPPGAARGWHRGLRDLWGVLEVVFEWSGGSPGALPELLLRAVGCGK